MIAFPLQRDSGERAARNLNFSRGDYSLTVNQISLPPKPPGRVEKKWSVLPSLDRAGDPSSAALLRGGPGLAGVDQRSEECSRVATQISRSPTPPVRSDVMKISRPSRLTNVRVSRAGLLSSGTSTPGLQTALSKSSSVVVVA